MRVSGTLGAPVLVLSHMDVPDTLHEVVAFATRRGFAAVTVEGNEGAIRALVDVVAAAGGSVWCVGLAEPERCLRYAAAFQAAQAQAAADAAAHAAAKVRAAYDGDDLSEGAPPLLRGTFVQGSWADWEALIRPAA